MKIIDLVQGSPEWNAHRAKHFNASDAPAMMGASKYATRGDLLKRIATGVEREIDAATQRRFDAGHAAEAAARPIVEARLGEELFPATGVEIVDGLALSASFDGITMLGEITWESKLLNASLVEQIKADDIDPHYYWQLEQQLLVSGAEKAYFTTSDGTEENTHGTFYYSVPARRAKLIAGWKQFAEDLANYQHVEAKPEVVAAPIEALPALMVQVEGRVVATNLDVFKEKAITFIAGIKTELVNDQDFADADKMVKFLGDGEKQLELVKSQAQAQAASIDDVFRAIDAVKAEMRTKRLALEKLVKTEKENRRHKIVAEAQWALQSYLDKLNERIGGDFLPPTLNSAVRFTEAIKGLKSLASMQDAVNTALTHAKIEAGEIADRIEVNKRVIDAVPDEFAGLFADLRTILLKDADDLKAVVASRIADHKAAVEKRQEAERERIRKEEEAKAQRAADGRTKTEADANQPNPVAPVEARTVSIQPTNLQSRLAEFFNGHCSYRGDTAHGTIIRTAIAEWEVFNGRATKIGKAA